MKKSLDHLDPLTKPENERLVIQVPVEILELLKQQADKRDTTPQKMAVHILVNWFKK